MNNASALDNTMSKRLPYVIGFLVIAGLLATSVYLQYFEGIMPCPLCTLQRISFGFLGILFLIGIVLYPKRSVRYLINSLASLVSILGIVLAGRQVWLQHFPSGDSNECGVSIQYMMQVLPMNQVVQKIFEGTAECSQRGWEFLSLNMAEWALMWFVLFFVLLLYLMAEEIRDKGP